MRVARRWAAALLGPDHPALAAVELCLDELTANSFQHTDSATVTIRVLRAPRAIRVEVHDAGAPGRVPHLRSAPDNDECEHGRGLHVVNALSRGRWGSGAAGANGRQRTWFEIGTGPGPVSASYVPSRAPFDPR